MTVGRGWLDLVTAGGRAGAASLAQHNRGTPLNAREKEATGENRGEMMVETVELLSLNECQKAFCGPRISCKKFTEITDSVIVAIQSEENVDMNQIAMIIDCLKQSVLILFEETDHLKKEMEKLKKLQKLEEGLLIGQIATKVEKEIIKRLLEGTHVEETYFLTINQLERACEKGLGSRQKIFSDQHQIDKANENWDNLETMLGLNNNIYGAIESFKSVRNIDAHPNLSVNDALKRLETVTSCNGKDKDMVKKLIEILQKLSVTDIGTH